MAKITMKEPGRPYEAVLDTGVMDVKLENVFTGVLFETSDGEKLSVSMRDSGFEIHYYKHDGKGFDSGWMQLNNGEMTTLAPGA